MEKAILDLGKIKMFSGAGYTNHADICRCPHCKDNMFVPTGAVYCPFCGEELEWINELIAKDIYDVNNLSDYLKVDGLIEYADRQCWKIYEEDGKQVETPPYEKDIYLD